MFRLQGNLKATTDLSRYEFGSGWIEFKWINGLNLIGGGVFDGQGVTALPYNDCPTSSNCDLLPTVCANLFNLTCFSNEFRLFEYF